MTLLLQKSNMERKSQIRNDIILIVGILIIAVIALIYLFVLREGGNRVVVTVGGKEFAQYPLSQDIDEDIYSGENGINHNRLIIKDGKAYVESANCPDGICVSHSQIHRKGESIVCLPHEVVITVIKADDNAPDLVI